jgi:amino acid transporter
MTEPSLPVIATTATTILCAIFAIGLALYAGDHPTPLIEKTVNTLLNMANSALVAMIVVERKRSSSISK